MPVKEAQKGLREKVAAHAPDGRIRVSLSVRGPSAYDFCCFGLDSSQKLSDDRYMVFFNRLKSPLGEVELALSPGRADFSADLGKLPQAIDRLVFTANADGQGEMSAIQSLEADFAGSLRLSLSGKDFSREKAVIVLEVYRKDGWRVAFTASGFNEGLPALLRHFGGEEAAPEAAAPQSDPAPQPAPTAPPPPPKPASPPTPPPEPPKPSGTPVRLGKISLAKGERVSLSKSGGDPVVVECGWTAAGKDYDLKALVRYRDGKLMYVGAAAADELIQTPEGAVRHSGDVKAPGELERLFVRWSPSIASVAISSYSAIENGTGSFKGYGVFVRVISRDQTVEIKAEQASGVFNSYTLCFGEISFGEAEGELEVSNLEMYSAPNSERRVGYRGGKVMMDTGPVGETK
ncbi:MAG: TerD family protein [Deltaproteobacteria bacterium]|jgi:stress response protein SCP2|nr:TerD family protein [Deltaproteobacteria bacterium]